MNRRIITCCILLLIFGACLFTLRADLSQWRFAKADFLYRKGDLRGAVTSWSSFAIVPSSRPQANFNRGVARYRFGELTEASTDFKMAAQSDDPILRQQALYNLGTTLLVMDRAVEGSGAKERLSEVVRHLQAAVDLNPADVDAVHNRSVSQARLAALLASTESGRQKTELSRDQQEKAAQSADASKKPGEAGTKAGKPGAATELDSTTGRRRTAPAISKEKALRMLDDARGREALRSFVVAGSRQEKLTPPEKDW